MKTWREWLGYYAEQVVILLQFKRLGDWLDQYWLARALAECVPEVDYSHGSAEGNSAGRAPVVVGPLMTECTRCSWDEMPPVRR